MFRDFQAIAVGDTDSLVKRITEEDVRRFVEMTGDDNPLHIDPRFAEHTTFKEVVVHGMLGASFISTVIGTKLPGKGALWLAQNMDFLLPVRLGDELTISCTVVKKHERERMLELDTRITNQNGQLVLSGSGRVKVMTSKAPEPRGVPDRPRVAIVTGGGGGIGRAICLRLASDGYNVVVNYLARADHALTVVDEINAAAKAKAVAVQADICTEAGVLHLYEASLDAFGAVSVLVNNASPYINPKALGAMEWLDVQRHIDVQVKGAFLMIQAVAPEMSGRGWGRIVNITSQVLHGQPSIQWTGYAMAKGALAVLSNYMAAELGPTGVTVNCVSPGLCETTLIRDVPEKAQLMIARQTPLRRLAHPTDVAGAVAYLVSEEAGFVTGDTLTVSGGMGMK